MSDRVKPLTDEKEQGGVAKLRPGPAAPRRGADGGGQPGGRAAVGGVGPRLENNPRRRPRTRPPREDAQDAGSSPRDAVLGEQLRRLRLARRWSQRRLAREAGVAQQNLSLYERGIANPRVETLVRLAAALDAEVRIVPRTAPPEAELLRSLATLLDRLDREIERKVRAALAREQDRSGGAAR